MIRSAILVLLGASRLVAADPTLPQTVRPVLETDFGSGRFAAMEPAKKEPNHPRLPRVSITFDKAPVKMHFRPPGHVVREAGIQ